MLLGRFESWPHAEAHVYRIKFTGKRLLNKQSGTLFITPRKYDGFDLNERMRVQLSDYCIHLHDISRPCVIQPIVVPYAECSATTLVVVHRNPLSQGIDRVDILDTPYAIGMKHYAPRFRRILFRALRTLAMAAWQMN